ncbi:IS66 family transposase [uncultured Photobacterium sp.]|uniref:IS66 family transposase n=1 Tax=uncultured Photobacterium sp. TaxID=173973 RepID=UPI0026194ECC|nr:IS66 family transposase [uncultured Photobacterium sp.]
MNAPTSHSTGNEMTQEITDIDGEELDGLIQRVQEATEHNLALSPQDCQVLLKALKTLAALQERLSDNDITLHKLRKLVGMVRSSETMDTLLGQGGKTNKKRGQKRPKPRSTKPGAPVKPKVTQHKLDGLSKGDLCRECQQGKLYKYEPATMLRISGQSPFVPEQHVMERLRCNACGQYFTAKLPSEVVEDGEPGQMYGYSARSLMALHKFFAGAPYYRQESIQALMGVKLTASTVFDQTELVANSLQPVYKVLAQNAANAVHYYLDDTGNRILNQVPVEKPQRNSDKHRLRSGVYSSGLVASLADGHNIVLYQTNIGHAGEFIDETLSQRRSCHPPPLLMSDALSSNRPSLGYEVQHCLCNSHGRRQFAEVLNQFPEEVEQVLKWYGEIWRYDDEARELRLNAERRLAWHEKHSLPVMKQIRDWGEAELANGNVEENSSLGKAVSYFNKHYEGLTAFCRIEGAQLDNNRAEQALKLVARNRKNAMFHKTQAGASIADVVMSMIATSAEAGINVLDYFNTLQRLQSEVRAAPERFLPWNYQSHI